MKHFCKIICMVFLLIALDQLTKSYFFDQPNSYFIHKHFNQYFLFGTFKFAPPEVKYLFTGISLSTVLILFCIIDYLYLANQRIVQFGLWMLIAGVFGNYIDKIFLEGVRDFIHVIPNVYTNFADLTQWIGFFLFSYGLFKYTDEIWHSSNNRKKILINPKEQLYFSLTLVLIVLFSVVAVIVTSLSFLRYLEVSNEKMETYLILSIGITFFILIATFLFSLVISSRIWGPIYSFKRHLQSQNKNKFQSRKSDLIQTLGNELAQTSRETK